MKPTNYLLGALLLALIVAVATCNCNGRKMRQLQKDCAVVKTVVKRDTAYLHDTVKVKIYVPQPYKVVIERKGENVYTTLERVKNVDTAALLKDYYATRFYSDTLKTKYGNIPLNDTISENRIAGRSWKADFTIPVVTNTVTNTVLKNRPPKRFGLGLQIGYGYTLDKKPQPYVGVGLSYNLLRFNL